MSVLAHTVVSVQQILTQNSVIPIPHPPYSADLTPSNYFDSSDEKKSSKGKVLLMWTEVKEKTAEALKGIKIKF